MGARKFAVFDIDGTLLRWQLYHAVVNALAKEGYLGAGAYEQLRNARMIWKRREHPDAFKQYERHMVEAYDTALTDLPVESFQAAARSVFEEYKDQVHVFTRDLVARLKDEGYVLLAISGSHHEMVGELANYYGFDDWIGSKYEIKDGHFTGVKHVPSEDKKKHFLELVAAHGLDLAGSVGVGDTISDAAFLDLVEQPIAFNPDQKLYEYAREKGWDIVVERKNVTYELSSGSGGYRLL